MRIVQTVPLEEPVPPYKYGGTELVVSLVTEELVRRGHEVYLLAAGNSLTKAKLVPILPKSIREMYKPNIIDQWREYWKIAGVAKMIEAIVRINPDIIHNHFAWRLVLFESIIKVPMVSTIHGPLTALNELQTYKNHLGHNYVSISHNQQKAFPKLNWVKTVYNGIDVNKYKVNHLRDNRKYFAFLGRISPEKGVSEIVQLIRRTKERLVIAAKVDINDLEYFESKVKPFIDGKQIKYIGEVGHSEKQKILGEAKALLLWLNWEEPFGLVIPEANACGTPVIVNRRGSMPELVRDGVNGFLVNSLDEMAHKITQVKSIDPNVCRQRVENLFSVETMTDGYVDVYKKILEQDGKVGTGMGN